jgi:predicted dehydrogenase
MGLRVSVSASTYPTYAVVDLVFRVPRLKRVLQVTAIAARLEEQARQRKGNIMADKLRWGLLGTGHIARKFAQGVAHSRTGQVVAAGSRSQAKAETIAEELGIPRRHASYEALLADPQVDAVYVSTPHPMHAEWAIKAAEAGKHVLCEKPLTMNHAQAVAVVEAARRADVFLMEAFMYRCAPQTARLVELIRSGAIGEVRIIRATFSFRAPYDPAGRLMNKAMGGGGIMDVGCYTASMARLLAGAAAGKDFAEPTEVQGMARIGATGVDEWAVAVLRFPGDVMACLSTGIQVNQDNTVCVFGSEGHILVPWPWAPAREGGTSRLQVFKSGQPEPEEVLVESSDWLYALEADMVGMNIARRQAPSPAMSWDDSLGNMQTLDRWRAAIGLTYEADGSCEPRA